MSRRILLSSVAVVLILGGTVLADAVGGPKSGTHVVDGNSTDTFTVVFRGGDCARVIVSGDGDTDLDLFVYDQSGNRVAFDDDDTDFCVASWVPRRTGRFTIRVVNRGGVYNRYTITTN